MWLRWRRGPVAVQGHEVAPGTAGEDDAAAEESDGRAGGALD